MFSLAVFGVTADHSSPILKGFTIWTCDSMKTFKGHLCTHALLYMYSLTELKVAISLSCVKGSIDVFLSRGKTKTGKVKWSRAQSVS